MGGTRSDSGVSRQPTIGLVLAASAVLCAAVAALVPAKELHGHYSWPPASLPGTHPERVWYTPLVLSRHQPESLSARFPCRLARSPQDSPRAILLLGTARRPAEAGGLAVTTYPGGRLRVSVGGEVLAETKVPSGSTGGTACTYRLELTRGRWSLDGAGLTQAGNVSMPFVDGLFSELDLTAGQAPSVDVTTTAYGSRSTLLQTILRSIGTLAALVALALVAIPPGRRRRPRQVVAGAARTAVAGIRLADGVVAAVLVGWWLLGPAFFDDGWVMAGQKNFIDTGEFSTYYDSFGVGSSLSYWLQWTEHWLFRSSNGLLLLRLPALVCLAATWVVCRWILSSVKTPRSTHSAAALWTLAGGFMVGALAWGMTLRPEPVVALLVAGVMACTVRFLDRETPAPLVVAAVLIVLAVTAHPAGLAALAPLLVAAPSIGRWLRPRLTTAATIALGAVALVGILAVLGSDLGEFRANAASLRTYGAETSGWRNELDRYSLLSRPLFGAPLRREWVVLALLAVLAFLVRRRRNPKLDLPGASLAIAFVLLIPTPAKVPWHFGTLIALAALALAFETARLAEDSRRSRGSHVRPLIIIAAAMLAAAWSWFPRNIWSDLDLRTLHWTLGIEQRITFAKLAGVVPLLVLGGFAVAELTRRSGGRRLSTVPWRAAVWMVPAVAAPLLVFTVAVLAADTAKTHSWTLGRQNLQTLTGKLGCGLADDAVVPARSSMRALRIIGAPTLPPAPAWLPAAPVKDLSRFALGTVPGGSTPASSPWFRLPANGRTGFFIAGTPHSADTFELEWGRVEGGDVRPLRATGVGTDFGDVALPDRPDWRFYAAADLPSPPRSADAVRYSSASPATGPPTAEIGFTAPVQYADEPLADLLRHGRISLVLPNLRAYLPCVTQPRVRGSADVPGTIIGLRNSLWPLGTGTSPFEGLLELYPLVRLPLSDSQNPPGDVSVYVVDQRIKGGAVAPAAG